MLLYIHIIFSRTPITCLDHIKSSWPRHGIVRIDITRSGQGNTLEHQDYLLQHSYAKEQRIHQREQFEYQSVFGFWGGPHQRSNFSTVVNLSICQYKLTHHFIFQIAFQTHQKKRNQHLTKLCWKMNLKLKFISMKL